MDKGISQYYFVRIKLNCLYCKDQWIPTGIAPKELVEIFFGLRLNFVCFTYQWVPTGFWAEGIREDSILN